MAEQTLALIEYHIVDMTDTTFTDNEGGRYFYEEVHPEERNQIKVGAAFKVRELRTVTIWGQKSHQWRVEFDTNRFEQQNT